jgi:hypothetical protein
VSKHTPGPWAVECDTQDSTLQRVYRVANGRLHELVAEVGHFQQDIDEQNANARLIAAAPDLLDALKNTLRMLEAAHRQLGMHSADNMRVRMAYAAQRKAEGAKP